MPTTDGICAHIVAIGSTVQCISSRTSFLCHGLGLPASTIHKYPMASGHVILCNRKSGYTSITPVGQRSYLHNCIYSYIFIYFQRPTVICSSSSSRSSCMSKMAVLNPPAALTCELCFKSYQRRKCSLSVHFSVGTLGIYSGASGRATAHIGYLDHC